METKHKVMIAVGALLLVGGTAYGVRIAEAKILDLKKHLAASTIDQSILQSKIKISKDGKSVEASTLTKTECQQALYLGSLNEEEYKAQIQALEIKINMIQDILSGN